MKTAIKELPFLIVQGKKKKRPAQFMDKMAMDFSYKWKLNPGEYYLLSLLYHFRNNPKRMNQVIKQIGRFPIKWIDYLIERELLINVNKSDHYYPEFLIPIGAVDKYYQLRKVYETI